MKYIVAIILVILVCVAIFGQFVKGEMLPEPSLKVYVEGMDTVDYWMDFLVKDEDINYKRAVSVRIEKAVEKLAEYHDDQGYHTAMLYGSEGEFVGGFDGFLQADGSIRHEFWGEGLPKEFKIIILTRDGRLITSDIVKVRSYHSQVRFNIGEIDKSKELVVGTGKIREVFPWSRAMLTFFVRLLVAFLIKISIIEAFGIKSANASSVVVKTILSTQIVVNLLLISQILAGAKIALLVFLIASLLMLIVECIIYALYIKDYELKTRIAAAVVSNLGSALAGYILIFFIEWVSF